MANNDICMDTSMMMCMGKDMKDTVSCMGRDMMMGRDTMSYMGTMSCMGIRKSI